MLDALKSPYVATLSYVGNAPSTQLTISVRYAGGSATCHPAANSNPSAQAMPAYVEVPVQIDFVTADGAFQESFSTTVDDNQANFGGPLGFYGVVAVGNLKGTYKPTVTGGTVTVSFKGYFSGSKTNGTVLQNATSGTSGAVARVGDW